MKSFTNVFRGGSVYSFSTTGLALLVSFGVLEVLRAFLRDDDTYIMTTTTFFSFGVGSSIIALFMRIGGGIFSNACDIGSNLIGKVMFDIPDDNPKNPAGK